MKKGWIKTRILGEDVTLKIECDVEEDDRYYYVQLLEGKTVIIQGESDTYKGIMRMVKDIIDKYKKGGIDGLL
jgi:hypothetical protein